MSHNWKKRKEKFLQQSILRMTNAWETCTPFFKQLVQFFVVKFRSRICYNIIDFLVRFTIISLKSRQNNSVSLLSKYSKFLGLNQLPVIL
jgi:hypothetical protein